MSVPFQAVRESWCDFNQVWVDLERLEKGRAAAPETRNGRSASDYV